MTEDDADLLRQAIAQGRDAMSSGNPPFGAVLAVNGKVVVAASNTTSGTKDFTAHAELNALRIALTQFPAEFLQNCVMYASAEPCPMCAGAIYFSGIKRIVFGSTRQRLAEVRGFGLDVSCAQVVSAGNRTVEVDGPNLESEILPMYEEFYKKLKKHV